MRRFRLEREQYLPLDVETTFSFFADAHNLERLTPPWLHFEVLSAGPMNFGADSLIDYRLRLRGIPVRWQSQIMVWEPPHRFVDVQRKGPYRLWEHTHSFEELGGGTLVRDVIIYAVPGGVVVNGCFVRPDIDRIFDFRARQLDAWAIEQMRRIQAASSDPKLSRVASLGSPESARGGGR